MLRVYLEYLGDSVELPRGEIVVGRDVGCALRFNDPSVSRRHLRFVRRADEAFVEDLQSSNGTLLNGRTVTAPIRVREGDEIAVGSRTLTVRVIENDEDVAAPNTLVFGEVGREPDADELVAPRAPTAQLPVVAEPPRATRSGTVDERWGGRPATPTLPPLDRRRHDRIPLELKLIYVSNELEIEAATRDLSQSGVFVRTQILDPAGTHCNLTLLIDGGPALRVRGIVRRVVEHNDRNEPVGLGVELVELGPTERAWIDIAATRITS